LAGADRALIVDPFFSLTPVSLSSQSINPKRIQ
jgi:hypothetical protein